MARQGIGRLVLTMGAVLVLAGCAEGTSPFGFLKNKTETDGEAPAPPRGARVVERDVEAPEVFQARESGLWDGRPSLGGVWVAHPDVTDPERVMIRNSGNGKSVIGALFRRERENPGPRLQVSSDAAAALGMLAGQPAELQVVALRRQEVAIEAPEEEAADAAAPAAPEAIEATTLEPVAQTAAAAIAAAEAAPAAKPVAPAAAAAPAPASAAAPAAPAAGTLDRPFVQIGIFSVEANAEAAAGAMRKAGLAPVVKQGASQGKTFWRVLVGPLAGAAERDAAIAKVKGLGYPDAYPVKN